MTDAALAETVRLSVVAGHKRVDLSLSAQVPVADLIPELARRLKASEAFGAPALLGSDGSELADDLSLGQQRVASGSIVQLIERGSVSPPRVYDDLTIALTEVVQEQFSMWDESASRSASVLAAALLTGLAAMGLLQMDWLSPEPPRLWVWQAGIGLFAVGSVGLLVPHRHSLLFAAPLLGGLLTLLCAAALGWVGLPPVMLLACIDSGLVVSVAALPRASLWLVRAASGGGDRALAGGLRQAGPIDEQALRDDVVAAHQLIAAVTVTVSVWLIVTAPALACASAWGLMVLLLCATALGLRARSHGSVLQRGLLCCAGWGSGVSAVAALLIIDPAHADTALLAAGAGLLAGVMVVAATSQWRSAALDRALELLESAVYLALPGVVVMAVGGFAAPAHMLLQWWGK